MRAICDSPLAIRREPHETAASFHPAARRVRCERARGRSCGDRRIRMDSPSAGLSGQFGAAADFGQRRRRVRRRRRTDAPDRAARAPAVHAPGTRAPRCGTRAHAPHAPVGQRRSDAAHRPGLLLGRAHARPRSGRDHAGRALLLRRREHQHGGWRVLDLRHVARASRAQRRRTRAHPPRARHDRRRRTVRTHHARPPASSAAARVEGQLVRRPARKANRSSHSSRSTCRA